MIISNNNYIIITYQKEYMIFPKNGYNFIQPYILFDIEL